MTFTEKIRQKVEDVPVRDDLPGILSSKAKGHEYCYRYKPINDTMNFNYTVYKAKICVILMILFLRKIPVNTLPSELHDFVDPALKAGWFSKSGYILRAEILVIEDMQTGNLEYHGLVHVDSESAGLNAIRKLKGKRFKNRPLVVREYVQRSWHNDRRQNKIERPEDIGQRVAERRRGSRLVISKYQIKAGNGLQAYSEPLARHSV